MVPQLTTTEQSLIDDVVRKDGGTPMDAPPSQPAGPPAASRPASPPARPLASQVIRQTARQPEPAHFRQWGGWGGSRKLFISSHRACANLPINMTQTNDLVN